MKDWEDKIANYLEKYDSGKECTEEDLEIMIEEGLRPLLIDYMALRKASSDLAETNLHIFRQVITNPNHKMRNSRLYNALSVVMNLTNDPAKLQ